MTTIKNLFFGRVFALILAMTAITGCHDEMADYKQTVRSGISILPWPKQMETLFGEGDHFITEYGFAPGPRLWNTEIYFGGRYRLTMQVNVEIDYKKHTIKKYTSPPKFYLLEVESLKRLDAERFEATYSPDRQWILDEAQWSKLVAAKGDWSAFGILVKKNSPLPDFDEYVKGWRAPRVQVR